MPVVLHNTLTKRDELFTPLSDDKVTLYTCGPTVYDYLHVGNWAAYIYWDTLVRTLRANAYAVERVMNITDVGHLVSDADDGEDKLEKGARREGKTAWDVATFYGDDFLRGMQRLGLLTPEHITKATDFIPQQLELVRTLKDKGYTYQIDDGIYFDTSKFPTYADFAGLDLEAQKAGARVEFNTEKRNPSDFALWKFTPAGETRDMQWDTPDDLLERTAARVTGGGAAPTESSEASEVGADRPAGPAIAEEANTTTKKGFPGWHLECSAMAMSILGNTIDIHTGGIDHIPVHHTNEIAQSEAATGVRFSNYWLHNNHIKSDGTKISKSLNNGYTLDDLEHRGFSPLDYRLFVLQGHYRSEGNFTFENLEAAKNRRLHWRNIAALRHQTHDTLVSDTDKLHDDITIPTFAVSGAITEALSNDLGAPQALTLIDEAFAAIEKARPDHINQTALDQLLETIDSLLGLQLIDTTPDLLDDVKKLIIDRQRARDEKDWETSDALRAEIEKSGVTVRDTAFGPIWEYIA